VKLTFATGGWRSDEVYRVSVFTKFTSLLQVSLFCIFTVENIIMLLIKKRE